MKIAIIGHLYTFYSDYRCPEFKPGKVGEAFLNRLAEKLVSQNINLVILAGDYVHHAENL